MQSCEIVGLLQFSLDELGERSVSISKPKIHNPELLDLCQQVDSLHDAKQQALILMIDGLVKEAEMEWVVGKRSTKR